jgi:hypothetical protein
VDVAAAGGWRTVETLKSAYQQADADTMLRVVLEAGELGKLSDVPEHAHMHSPSRAEERVSAGNGVIKGKGRLTGP